MNNQMPKNYLNNDVSVEHFKALFEYANMGILVTDSDDNIIDINPFALKEFGYSNEELAGKKVEKLLPSRFHDEHAEHRKMCTESQQTSPGEQKIELLGLRKDGTEFPIEINLSPYKSNGKEYMVTFIINISSRKEAESKLDNLNANLENTVMDRTKDLQEAMQQLEKSGHRLEHILSFQKALLDTAGAMIIATDKNGIINLFNPEAARKLGYSPSEVLHKKKPLLFHDQKEIERKRKQLSDEFGIKVENPIEVLVANARRNIHEEEQYNYIDKMGNAFPISLTVTALRNTQGDITGFMGIAVDISERIKVEKKLKRAEHLFLQLLHNYPDGIISIIDRDYHFLYTGGDLHNQLHADVSKLIGKEIFPLFPKELREIILSILERVFQDKVHITGFELPYPVAKGDYLLDAFPLLEEDGSLDNIGVIIKNISKLKRAEKNLREDLKIEKDLNELKSRFVSMASHEFRTPLSTVLSSAYLIEKYTSEEDQPKRDKHLRRIVSSVNMLTDILNDFLSLGKIEEGKLQAKFSEFDMQEMIEATIDELKHTLKKGQYIHYSHEEEAMAFLDLSMFKHILMNLVSNASKFSPEASSIDIKTKQHQGHITLSVKDKGIGISGDDQHHLMDRFFRARNAQNIQGTGLGLHIVSKYAEMMNGNIQFESELGEGTEFIVTFEPLKD